MATVLRILDNFEYKINTSRKFSITQAGMFTLANQFPSLLEPSALLVAAPEQAVTNNAYVASDLKVPWPLQQADSWLGPRCPLVAWCSSQNKQPSQYKPTKTENKGLEFGL